MLLHSKAQRFLKYKGKFYGYCHCCHNFGHKAADSGIKRKDQGLKIQRNRRSVSRVPHRKMWGTKLDYKDSKHQ